MISVLEDTNLVQDSKERCPFHVPLKLFWPNSVSVSYLEESGLNILLL